MPVHKIPTIPDFDRHFRAIGHDEARRIYNNPKIGAFLNKIETSEVEETRKGVFLDICNCIAEQSGSAYVFKPFTWPKQHHRDEQKSDICLVDRNASAAYMNMHVVGELTPSRRTQSRTDDSQSKAEPDQLSQYAYKILSRQDFRLRLFAFTLRQRKIRTFMFSRYMLCSSDEFDITVNPVRFVRVFASFLRMTRDQLGYDPTYITHPNGKTTLSMVDGNNYQLELCLFSSVDFDRRSTSVWTATKTAGSLTETFTKVGETVIIKDCWQITDRTEEGNMLKQATECQNPLFPQGFDLNMKHQHHISDWPKPRRFTTHIHHETVKHKGAVASSADRRIRATDSGPLKTPVCSDYERAALGDDWNPREHRRVVVKNLECKRIDELESLLDIFTAIRDCVDGHWALYRAGVLHRDVSKDNLMVAMTKEKQKFDYGFLIDLDFAANADLATRIACKVPFAAGNKLFMARDVLEWLAKWQLMVQDRLTQDDMDFGSSGAFKQEYCHDIESFYWVLLWCLVPMDQSIRLSFEGWAVDDYHLVKAHKVCFLLDFYQGRNYYNGCRPSVLTGGAFSARLISLTKILEDRVGLKMIKPEELYCRL